MTKRTVHSVHSAPVQRHGPGLATTDIVGGALGDRLDPFIVVSFYEMSGPTFPPHPHAGFSVATYILPESPIGFINHDTLGNRNRIAPGALHVTVAGKGVQHEEQPERAGPTARGFQIWMDHANAAREIEPHALHLRAGEVPVAKIGGALVRAVLGFSNGVASPVIPPTPVRAIDVALEDRAFFSQSLDQQENAFLFLLEGRIRIGEAEARAGDVLSTARNGDTLEVEAQDGPARFTLFAGKPLNQQRVQRGPFVARDNSQLQRFMDDFQQGRFGALKRFADQPDWAPNDGQTLGR